VSANSKIEWCTASWNPVLGCDRVSPGCDHCYAITQARIRERNPHPRVAAAFAGLTHRTEAGLDWTGRINLLPERLAQPLAWRKPERVFVNSLADLFHKDVPGEFIARVFAVMALCPHHTFLLLTKRHGRMRSLLSSVDFGGLFEEVYWAMARERDGRANDPDVPGAPPLPLPNVHLGVSAESQKWADVRIPALLDTPAAIRWVSAEPLVGPLDLHYVAGIDALDRDWIGGPGGGMGSPHPLLDWVVAGGESGPGARPMHPGWVRSLRDQCVTSEVPFFFKQWGEWRPGGDPARPAGWFDTEGQPCAPGCGTPMVKVGKKAAGRTLDGWRWDELPASPAGVSA
jgi:protein gp37